MILPRRSSHADWNLISVYRESSWHCMYFYETFIFMCQSSDSLFRTSFCTTQFRGIFDSRSYAGLYSTAATSSISEIPHVLFFFGTGGTLVPSSVITDREPLRTLVWMACISVGGSVVWAITLFLVKVPLCVMRCSGRCKTVFATRSPLRLWRSRPSFISAIFALRPS